MTKLYKLTTEDFKTRKCYPNETTWGENVTHSGTGKGDLCGPGYIHAYLTPELAVLLNPIHANIKNPVLWEAEGDIVKKDGQMKVGCISLTTTKQVPLPNITKERRIAFAILAAKEIYDDQKWIEWADNWLNGSDRSIKSAKAAYSAAQAAASAAQAAASATQAAAYSAFYSACATHAAASAAQAAYSATSATHAAHAEKNIDLVKIAEKAMEY